MTDRLARTGLGYAGYALFGPWGGLAGTIIGGLLFPPKKSRGPVEIAQLQLSVPQKGQVLPVVYGVRRVPGYYIWYGNFKKHEPSGGKKGGGKGMQDGKGEATSVPTYSASFAFGVCEGVDTDAEMDLLRIWAGDDVIWNSDGSVGAGLSFTFYKGLTGQAVDPHIAQVIVTQGGGSTSTTPIRRETATAPTTEFLHTVQKPPIAEGTERVYRTQQSTEGDSYVYLSRVSTLTGPDQYTVNYATGQITVRVASVGTQVTFEYQSAIISPGTQEPIAYPHTAYVMFKDFDMGPSTTPPNYTFEICRKFPGGGDPNPTASLTWTQVFTLNESFSRRIRDGLYFGAKTVFWKLNPSTAAVQLLHSADGATWSTSPDVDSGYSGNPQRIDQLALFESDAKLAIMSSHPGDTSSVAVRETSDLVAFVTRYNQTLSSTDVDGGITKVGTVLWPMTDGAVGVSPLVFEDTGSAFTQRGSLPTGAATAYAVGFSTVYVAQATAVRRWNAGASTWDLIWTAPATIQRLRYWAKQNRLILVDSSTPSKFYAYDGSATPSEIWAGQVSGIASFVIAVGDDLYFTTLNALSGATTLRIYRATSISAAPVLIGTITSSAMLDWAPLVWNPTRKRFHVAVHTTSGPARQMIFESSEVPTTAPVCGDVNLTAVIKDIATHTRYGLSMAASATDSTTYQAVFDEIELKDLKASPVLDQARSALEYMEEVLSIYDGFLVPSQGVLKFGIRKVEGTSRVIVLEDFTAQGMPTVSRQGVKDTRNRIVVEYTDRSQDYGPAFAKADDDVSIGATGERVEQIALLSVTRKSVATKVASRVLATLSMQKTGIAHGLDPKWGLLEAGDLYAVVADGVGLNGQVLRIVGFSENPEWGITVGAFEEPLAYLTADPNFESQAPGPFFPPPGPIETAVTTGYIVELPYEIAGDNLRLAMFGAGAGTGWLGCDVFVSRDGIEYALLGSVAKGITGFLSSPLPLTDSRTEFNRAVDVDISESEGTLLSTSRDGFWAQQNLIVVGSTSSVTASPGPDANRDVEWMTFETATLLGTSRYRLQNFMRSLYDLAMRSHPNTTKFLFFDPRKALIRQFSDTDIGKRLYFKFETKMQFGNNVLTVNPTYLAYVPQGLAVQPDPVDLLQVRRADGVKLGAAMRF